MGYAVLDATTGGKHIWHPGQKDAERTVFVDRRHVPKGTIEQQEGWSCEPDVIADCRALPFPSGTFDLVCFDPPHIIKEDGMSQLSGVIEVKYGALRAETWQADLRDSFTELWRVLRPGGTLTLKWADTDKSNGSVLYQLPETPLYGVSRAKGEGEVNWWVFHKGRAE